MAIIKKSGYEHRDLGPPKNPIPPSQRVAADKVLDEQIKHFHVHIYETPRMAEVDVEAADEEGAMTQAIQLVTEGTVACDQLSPTKHLALAFAVSEREKE